MLIISLKNKCIYISRAPDYREMADNLDETSTGSRSRSHTSRSPASSPKAGSRNNAAKQLTKKNRLGLTPPKRIDVANTAVADELLVSQNLLFLQQDDYYKAQEHIQLLSGEVDNLKVVVKKKQDLINRLQQGISDRDVKIEELKLEVKNVHVERSAFKVLEDQNTSLISKVTNTGQKLEDTQIELKNKVAEGKDIRDYSDKKVADAIKTEVMLQATIQQITYNLSIAEKSKDLAENEQNKLKNQMVDLSKHLQMVSETSKEQLYRSRVTEYRTLKRLDDMTEKMTIEKDEKEMLKDTVQMASMRGDVLSHRLGDALDQADHQQLMVQSIVRQVENSNDALRGREKVFEKQNMHLTAQLKISQMAVADMIRRYKIAQDELEKEKIEIYSLKQKLKPKKKGEIRNNNDDDDDNVTTKNNKMKRPPGMAGSTTANANKIYMEKLANLTSESLSQTFPREPYLANSVSNSILEGVGSTDLSVYGGNTSKHTRNKIINNNSANNWEDDGASGSAMSDYKAFIQDLDEKSQHSAGTFNTQRIGGDNGSYAEPDGSVASIGGLSGGKTMFYDGGSVVGSQASVGSFQPMNGSLSGGGSVYGGGSSVVGGGYHDSRGSGTTTFTPDGRGGLTTAPSNQGWVSSNHQQQQQQQQQQLDELPQSLKEQESQALGKANLLAAYLRLMISYQNTPNGTSTAASNGRFPQLTATNGSASSLSIVDLQRCELSDDEMKQIIDLLRLLSIRHINMIDLRYNHFSGKSVDVFAAYIVGIAGSDLTRHVTGQPLDIDLRYNNLSKKAIERLLGKIRMTPRPEVKLVQTDGDGQIILLYGINKVLVRIDCRNNTEKVTKLSLKERLSLGSSMSGKLDIAYPGDDLAARNPNYFEGTIYPRDSILNAVSYD